MALSPTRSLLMEIKPYNEGNHRAIADLFTDCVHAVCARDYSPDQLEAWAPRPIDYEHWEKRCALKQPFVAVIDDKIVGFVELEDNGHIDCFYVHKSFQRRGVGAALLSHVENLAKSRGNRKLFAEVSLTAKPFFKAHGFHSLSENTVMVTNIALVNFNMEKELAP